MLLGGASEAVPCEALQQLAYAFGILGRYLRIFAKSLGILEGSLKAPCNGASCMVGTLIVGSSCVENKLIAVESACGLGCSLLTRCQNTGPTASFCLGTSPASVLHTVGRRHGFAKRPKQNSSSTVSMLRGTPSVPLQRALWPLFDVS